MTNSTPNTKPTEPVDDEGKQYYDSALSKIDDLEPFVVLVDELCSLAAEGRVNDMRRKLVVFHVNLLTADRQQLLDRVEKEVIGEDMPVFKYIDALVDDKKRKACNKLLAKQRTALAKLRKDLG